MIQLDITCRNFEADDKLRAYVTAKIGEIEKYLPRRVRQSATAKVRFEDDASGREDNRFVCEVVLTLPGDILISKEGTINMYAAIDIVEAKLKAQVRTYKDKNVTQPRRARMLTRLMGRKSETDTSTPGPEMEEAV
jgi:ribosomal subunit interface protein